MVLARYRIKCHASLGQHLANAYFAAVSERGVMLAYDINQIDDPIPLYDVRKCPVFRDFCSPALSGHAAL